jgi:hypothetical protein
MTPVINVIGLMIDLAIKAIAATLNARQTINPIARESASVLVAVTRLRTMKSNSAATADLADIFLTERVIGLPEHHCRHRGIVTADFRTSLVVAHIPSFRLQRGSSAFSAAVKSARVASSSNSSWISRSRSQFHCWFPQRVTYELPPDT